MKRIFLITGIFTCLCNLVYSGSLKVDVNAIGTPIIAQATAVAQLVIDQKATTKNAYVWVLNPQGTPTGVTFYGGGVFSISQPYLYSIAEGDIAGHNNFSKIAFNPDIGTTQETIWSHGGEYVYPPVTGTALEVVSDSAGDILGSSTGIWGVYVEYLDTNYDPKTAYVYLSGTAAQQVTGVTASRINGFRVWTGDGVGRPAGNITLRHSGGGTVYSYITAGYTRARSSVYTVARGKTLFVTSVSFSAVGSKYVRFTSQATYDTYRGVTTKAGILFYPFTEMFLLNSSFTKTLEVPTKFPAYTDLKISGISDGTSALCTANYAGWIE